MKSFSCGEVVPGCDARFTAETEDDVLRQVGAHAARDHGMSDVPDSVLAAVRAGIVTSP